MSRHTLKICSPAKKLPNDVVLPHELRFMVGENELSNVTDFSLVLENGAVVGAKIELAVAFGEYEDANN